MGPLAFSVTGGGTRSAGFNAIVNPDNFSYNPDRDGYSNENVGGNAVLAVGDGTGRRRCSISATVSNNQFDGGAPDFDDRTIDDARGLVGGQPQPHRRASWTSILTVGEGSDDSVSLTAFGESPFKTTQRQYTWQNDWHAAARRALARRSSGAKSTSRPTATSR